MDRDRTGDIQIFSLALSQLSYHPEWLFAATRPVYLKGKVAAGIGPPELAKGVPCEKHQTAPLAGVAVANPPAAHESQLRDYWRPMPDRRVAALVDWEGDASGGGLVYRFGDKVVQANNDVVSAITGLPAQFRDNWRLLADPTQRKLLARSLFDESFLTPRRRKAVFSLLLWGSLFLWVTVGVVVAIVNYEALGTYQSVYGLFFYSLATSIFLPTPFEILLSNAVDELGVFWTVTVAAIAKVAGSWVVLMMGDKANEGLAMLLEKRPLLKRIFKALERFAQKFGYWAVFVLFAIPFMSDTAPLFILAVLKMRKSIFLAVTFAAIVARSLLFIYAGDFFAGLF